MTARGRRAGSRLTEVEPYGIDTIPPEERFARPRDMFRIAFGASNSIATMVLGSLPIVFGLSFGQGLLAVVAGVLAGGILLSPMALFGPINGTNNAVSSGAHFGVVGRILGSFLSLLTAITFSALAVWASGDAIVAAANRLFGTPQSDLLAGIAYGGFAIAVLTVVVYGFRFMLLVNRVAVIGVTVLMVLGVIAFAGDFDAGYPGIFTAEADRATRDLFWPTLVGAALISMSNPVSYGAFLGDWSRYIPAETPRHRLMLAAFASQVATLAPFVFGLATTAIVAAKAPEFVDPAGPSFVGGLVAIAPTWYLAPLIGISLIGGMSVATATLYGTGLDFSSVFPVLSRVQATLLIGGFAVALLFVGRFVLDLLSSITTFATLIVVCTSPWMVMMLIGFFVRRGWYLPEHLQVFNNGQRGGIYWFTRGVNWRALGAWIPSAVISLLMVNIPGQFVGPWSGWFSGVDASLPAALLLSFVLYSALLFLFPEPRHAFGPEGARLVPTADRPATPITGEPPDSLLARLGAGATADPETPPDTTTA
jgi:purine-cytosine permease-like protein